MSATPGSPDSPRDRRSAPRASRVPALQSGAPASRMRERQDLLTELVEANGDVLRAHDRYRRALVSARSFGLSHLLIAKQVGKTEAAVRLYLKRNKLEESK